MLEAATPTGLPFERQTSSSTSAFVKQLQKAGFIVVGQSSFPEMGWINVTNSNLYGNTHNPWQLDQNPGGSSGGSAAAVASGQVSLASASDGGGSTRIPASWSGLIGLHPTRGILEEIRLLNVAMLVILPSLRAWKTLKSSSNSS